VDGNESVSRKKYQLVRQTARHRFSKHSPDFCFLASQASDVGSIPIARSRKQRTQAGASFSIFSKTSTKPRFFNLKPLSALFRTIIKSRGTNILVESFRAPDQRLWLTSEAHEASDVEFKIGLMALHQEVRDSKPRFVLVAVSCVQTVLENAATFECIPTIELELKYQSKDVDFLNF